MNEIRVEMPEREVEEGSERALLKRVSPAGWLALAVVLLTVLAGCAWAVKTAQTATADLEDLATMEPVATHTPTATPTVEPTETPTPGPSPTPEGWTVQTGPDGSSFLSPPPEDEAAIREAFQAVLAVELIVAETPQQAFEMYDREAVLEKAMALSVPEMWVGNPEHWSPTIIPPEHMGTENPVRCEDHGTCSLVRAKMGPHSGAVIYDELCEEGGLGPPPCLAVPPLLDEDPAPYMAYRATIELQEDGTWLVTNWGRQRLPPPPSSLSFSSS